MTAKDPSRAAASSPTELPESAEHPGATEQAQPSEPGAAEHMSQALATGG